MKKICFSLMRLLFLPFTRQQKTVVFKNYGYVDAPDALVNVIACKLNALIGVFTNKLTIILPAYFLITSSFQPVHQDNSTITIRFKHWAGNKELKLFDETYVNSFGEPFVISKFKYYISRLSFIDVNNKETYLPDNYYLINEADSLSKIIELPALAAIKSISFVVGVDSIRNVSGVQTGSLDPMNGMFWTWNSGYVFAKLEGESDSSHAPVHSFSWDIGGFRQHENALRRIKLTMGKSTITTVNTIIVDADILKWFNAVRPVKIAESPVCHQPGKLAMQIADNYSAMFSIAP